MASPHRVCMRYERIVTFYVEAENADDVHDFLESNSDWIPEDQPGLIDSDEMIEQSVDVEPSNGITANYRINDELDLEEIP